MRISQHIVIGFFFKQATAFPVFFTVVVPSKKSVNI
jgi:hypothetical protein